MTLKTSSFLFSVATNIITCGDWPAGPVNDNDFPGTYTDAVADPSNYDTVIFCIYPFLTIIACSDFVRRCLDQGRERLRLVPETLDFSSFPLRTYAYSIRKLRESVMHVNSLVSVTSWTGLYPT